MSRLDTKQEQINGPNGARRRSRTRSPNFPAISLPQAISRARELFDEEQRQPANIEVVAEHWGYSNARVSGAMQTVAALRAYGLISVEGTGDGRTIKLTDRAIDILVGGPDARNRAIVAASQGPDIFSEVLSHYGGKLPSDANLTSYLIRDLAFNSRSVGSFISSIRDTLALANQQGSGTISGSNGEGKTDIEDAKPPKIGDFVLWSSQGTAQFHQPRRVCGLSPDEKWVFVDGSQTGIPTGEVTVVEAPKPSKGTPMTATAAPPPNPHYAAPAPAGEVPIAVKMPDKSVRTISIPKMDRKGFNFFKSQLEAFEDVLVIEDDAKTD
jgi:hypothetical protein